MATSRTAWGVDVGNRALKAVRLGRAGDGIRIEDFDVIEHETPLSQSGDNRDSLISRALTEFTQRHKTGQIPVGISVAGGQSFAKFVKLPPVEEKRIPEIVRFEAIQQIPFPLDDVEFDWQLFRKQDDPDVEVGLFAMRKELVNRYVAAYTDVNLNVQVVQMSPLAVYNAMKFDGRLDSGTTLVIDMGAETTDLVVSDGGQIWQRSIPIGGNNFTETLVRTFKLDFAKAEEMKREASTSKYARQIFQAMRPVFADLVAEIQRSVGFYASTHRDAKLTKAIALGGTFKLPGLQKYLQQNLQLDVERVESFASVTAPADQRLLAVYQDNVLSAVTAYGLAVQAMGEGTVTTSLLPSHIRREKIWKDKTKYFVAASALFVAGAAVAVAGAMLPQFQHDSAQAERDHIQSVLSQAEGFDREYSSNVESAGQKDRDIIKNVMSLTADRDTWPQIVATIRGALPNWDPATLKAAKPENRQDIRFDGWESIYFHDMGGLLKDSRRGRFATEQPVVTSVEGGGGGAPPIGMPPGFAAMRGGMGARPSFGAPFGGGGGGGASGFGGASGADLQLENVPADVITAATQKPGFVLRMTGITSNPQASRLLNETFFHDLVHRYAPADSKVELYVADAFLIRQGPVRNNTQRLQEIARANQVLKALRDGVPIGSTGAVGGGFNPQNFGGGPPGGFPGGPMIPNINVPNATGSTEDPSLFIDPATGEDMREFTEFQILVFMVLGQPAAPPAPTGGNPQ